MRGLTCFGREQAQAGKAGCEDLDATRVTLNVAGTGLTGFEFERRLNRDCIYPEMATLEHVLFLVTPGTNDGDLDTAVRALKNICKQRPHMRRPPSPLPPVPEMAVIPRVAKFSSKRTVALDAAVGRVSGETVATYPPERP